MIAPKIHPGIYILAITPTPLKLKNREKCRRKNGEKKKGEKRRAFYDHQKVCKKRWKKFKGGEDFSGWQLYLPLSLCFIQPLFQKCSSYNLGTKELLVLLESMGKLQTLIVHFHIFQPWTIPEFFFQCCSIQ